MDKEPSKKKRCINKNSQQQQKNNSWNNITLHCRPSEQDDLKEHAGKEWM